MGANMLTVIAPHGAWWRAHRRLWQQHFGPKAMELHNTLLQVEARALARRLLQNDRNVCNQLKLFVLHLDDISHD